MNDEKFSYMSVDWLEGHENFIEKFLQDSDILFMKKGDLLLKQGEQVDRLYLVLKGTVESYFESGNGKQKTTGIVQRGMLVGLTGLNDYTEHHTLRCRTSAIVASAPMEIVYRWDSEMLLSLIQMQTRKIRMAFAQMLEQSTRTIEARLLKFLLEAGLTEEDRTYAEIPVHIVYSKQEIANIVGSTRERVNQVMNDLQKKGCLKAEGRDIYFYSSRLSEELKKF